VHGFCVFQIGNTEENVMKKLFAVILSITMVMTSVMSSSSMIYAAASENVNAKTTIDSLKVDNKTNPMGIDNKIPVFKWVMESNVVGNKQTAYEIVVENSSDTVVWDSGKVESSDSIGIEYNGGTLAASTAYTWTVEVWDANGNSYKSDAATFETGLMSTSADAWSCAKWIGATDYYLDAASVNVFYFYGTVNMSAAEDASLVFGANDTRLYYDYMNTNIHSGESYVKATLNKTDKTFTLTGVGYGASDNPSPYYTASIKDIISANGGSESYAIKIFVDASAIKISVNGTAVSFSSKNGSALAEASESAAFTANTGGDYNTYPNLDEIGFAASKGSSPVFSDVCVKYYTKNTGDNVGATVFGSDTGATYSIFSSLDNSAVTVNTSAETIKVNASSQDVLAYADPSYGSTPMLRTDFSAEKQVSGARLYVTARGVYEMYINGKRVGDDYFNPGSSSYGSTIYYSTYDVSDYVTKGGNAIGAVLAPGWWSDCMSYNPENYNFWGDKQSLLSKLVITYTDGTTETVVTNPETWSYYNNGPIKYSSFFQGERYDATTEQAVEKWSEYGYDASGWSKSAEITPVEKYSNPKIVASIDDTIKAVDTIDGTYEKAAADNSSAYIFNMGTNMVGIPKITLKNTTAGQKIIIRTAEKLYPDTEEYKNEGLAGEMMVENLRAALSTDYYTCKGGETETIQPSFTYHGYQYIEISGASRDQIGSVKGIVLSSITNMTGAYSAATADKTETAYINQLYKNIQRSQYSNFLSIPTDCNQRNERMGWTGDASIFAKTALFNADVSNIYNSFLNILSDEQADDGGTNMTAPGYSSSSDTSMSFGMAWDSCSIVVAYQTYMQTGDTDIIKKYYDMMYKVIKKCMDAPLDSTLAPDLTADYGFLGDHLSIESTDACLINNAYYIYVMNLFSKMAKVIGKENVAAAVSVKAKKAKAEWNSLYVDPDTGKTQIPAGLVTTSFGKSTTSTKSIQDTQASYALPLSFGVFSYKNKEKAIKNLARTVASPADGSEAYTLTTGFTATSTILPALTKSGKTAQAYKLFEQTDYASWLYPVTQGATSIWERWNSYTEKNGFGGNNSMNSFNHYSLGAVGEWMYEYQLGISAGSAGYKTIVLQPTVGGDFTSAKGSYMSSYGKISSSWTADGKGNLKSYSCTVPANTSATLYLPVDGAYSLKSIDGVTDDGLTVHNGVTCAKVALDSGGYTFEAKNNCITVKPADGYVNY
jgi:alpha-L-rhamnosidase